MTDKYSFNDCFTEFATATRSSMEQIMVDKWNIEAGADTLGILDAVPEPVLVLNANRQIVYVNKSAAEYISQKTGGRLYGLRPGEAIGCVRAFESGSGCGTTHFCSTCGAVNSILQSIKGMANMQECRIADTLAGGPLELRIWTSPVNIKGEIYHVFALNDIADEKRRNVLERIFFHDILNLAGSLQGLSYLFHDPDEDTTELIGLLDEISSNLVNEIQAQRILLDAENNKLVANKIPVQSNTIMNSVASIYSKHLVSQGKSILVDESSQDVTLLSDDILLKRVLANMLKNALEATENGKAVTMNSIFEDNMVIFSVHNDKVMPQEIQLQVFQRSFSTKGTGRGLGTYSIKLLGEKYLGGTVGFISEEDKGTTFFIKLPIDGKAMINVDES